MPGIYCTICSRVVDASIATLKCGHVFHEKCITKSLKREKSCPYCKRFADDMIILERMTGPQDFIKVEDIIDLTNDENDEILHTLRDEVLRFSGSLNKMLNDIHYRTTQTINDISERTNEFISSIYNNAVDECEKAGRTHANSYLDNDSVSISRGRSRSPLDVSRSRSRSPLDVSRDRSRSPLDVSRGRSRSPLDTGYSHSNSPVVEENDKDDETNVIDDDDDNNKIFMFDRHGKGYSKKGYVYCRDQENLSIFATQRDKYMNSSKFNIKRERFSTDRESVTDSEVSRENTSQLNKVEIIMSNREIIDKYYSKDRYYELLTRAVPKYYQQYFNIILKLPADYILEYSDALEQLMDMLSFIMPDSFGSDYVTLTYYSNVLVEKKHYGFKIQFYFKYPEYSVWYIDNRHKLRTHKYYCNIYEERYYKNRISQHLLFK
ncbi:paxp-1-like protein [Glossina pallidipes salivary gland hypertrophy virus]|uniref:Paxp-1-like protein n=1 Tax=Glossina hytrovirus (isolate Glossina pallidipes/Ethiopia/Seibersdorf/-) TaxID=379529 RepID=A0A0Y0K783_GHVS|nr:paxp-1-like protein [Glossina pallidipes salivary gland hypertrophy virus]